MMPLQDNITRDTSRNSPQEAFYRERERGIPCSSMSSSLVAIVVLRTGAAAERCSTIDYMIV